MPHDARGIIQPHIVRRSDITVSKATLICNRVTLFDSIEVRRLKSKQCRRKPLIIARHLLGVPFVTSRNDRPWSAKSLQSQFLVSARSRQWHGPRFWAGACTSCFVKGVVGVVTRRCLRRSEPRSGKRMHVSQRRTTHQRFMRCRSCAQTPSPANNIARKQHRRQEP